MLTSNQRDVLAAVLTYADIDKHIKMRNLDLSGIIGEFLYFRNYIEAICCRENEDALDRSE